MKALILNGAFEGQTNLDQAGDLLVEEFKRLKWEPVLVRLRDMNIRECVGCFNCWVKTPGLCSTADDAKELNRHYSQADLFALITPIRFGGYGSILKKAMERTVLPNLLPFMESHHGETHHPTRNGKGIKLLGIGGLRAADPSSEQIFEEILRRNTLNLHGPIHRSTVLYEDLTVQQLKARIRDLVVRAEVN